MFGHTSDIESALMSDVPTTTVKNGRLNRGKTQNERVDLTEQFRSWLPSCGCRRSVTDGNFECEGIGVNAEQESKGRRLYK
jgi:hypothetical protein